MTIRLNGRPFAEKREMIPVFNPADNTVIDFVPNMVERDIDEAIAAAGRAFSEWAGRSQWNRSQILEEFIRCVEREKDELARLLSDETGKPLGEAQGELAACGIITKAYCERANHMYGNCLPKGNEALGNYNDVVFTRREPIGVFGCIIPFNFPAAMFAHKLIPAVVVGNTAVVKPPTECPLTLLRLVECLYKAGMPEQAVQAVTGRGAGAAGSYLVSHPGLNALSMTGSEAAGLSIYQKAAPNLTRVFLELGANDAFIVMEDADLDLAVKEAMMSRLLYAGQVCCGSKRFLVHEGCLELFVEKLITALRQVKMGDPKAPGTTMGCLISEAAAKQVEAQVAHTMEQGADCAFGGHRSGAFYEPTVLTGVTAGMDIARDMEVFGPVFSIISVGSAEEAVQIANQSRYGLSGAVFSENAKLALSIAERLETATVVVNGGTDYRPPELAFGGYKKSGIGREGVSRTLEEMTQEKNFVLKDVFGKL
ncbi:aldehyde dehydrogenase family protein [uncultured Oscillibacter sp.]|uniref:aldehyde dehydrogenase family protein n=1 Tax=uncultured Oscillibacter sp. TaxID=876091 RepID=UPI002621A160|nr:aldehyde dehydrogenase family protein [uncultured Oscillibacter sp.]